MKPFHQHAEADEMESMMLRVGLICCQLTTASLFSTVVVLSALCEWESCPTQWFAANRSGLTYVLPCLYKVEKKYVQALMASRFSRLNTAREAALNDLPGLCIGNNSLCFCQHYLVGCVLSDHQDTLETVLYMVTSPK